MDLWIFECEVCEEQFIDPTEAKDHMFAYHINMIKPIMEKATR